MVLIGAPLPEPVSNQLNSGEIYFNEKRGSVPKEARLHVGSKYNNTNSDHQQLQPLSGLMPNYWIDNPINSVIFRVEVLFIQKKSTIIYIF